MDLDDRLMSVEEFSTLVSTDMKARLKSVGWEEPTGPKFLNY